jgi:hypothetical protein
MSISRAAPYCRACKLILTRGLCPSCERPLCSECQRRHGRHVFRHGGGERVCYGQGSTKIRATTVMT